MKLSQKKNCNGCKSGYYTGRPFTQYCDLGYKVNSENYTGIPQEPCYKPKTNNEWLAARNIVFKR